MSLFTSRVYVACFLAIILLGGLASRRDYLAAMSNAEKCKFYSMGNGDLCPFQHTQHPVPVSNANQDPTLDNADFSWDMLIPGKSIIWHKCFPDRQCARLIVPLNYSDPQGAEAIIALIRKPSTLAESSREYRGPILFSPGGPGISGVEWIQSRAGDIFSTVVGPQFDIVGFDARGVGQSTPRVALFRTAAERALWYVSGPPFREGDVADTWARAMVFGQLAEDLDDGYLRHINTDQTARDMLRIVQAHGRTKIQYWGVSYGSVLGAVFASMFPDNIERLVVDGVLDSENSFATLWSNNLLDVNKTMESFYTECAGAGSDRCAFWAPSPDDIRQNLTNLYASINVQPVPVKTGNAYGYVDYKMLHSIVFRSLYTPLTSFRHLAQGLTDLAAGDGTTIFKMAMDKIVAPSPFECTKDSSKELEHNTPEASVAIYCNDGVNIPADLESAQKHFKMMSKVSEFGNLWASVRIRCAGWPKFPKNHFRGPFEANTSHPILLIATSADPVSPVWAANKMSRGFNSSIVLTQNSTGHCSISAPSLCTAKYVQQYFINGTLPKPGTVCQADLRPFDSVEQGSPEEAQGRMNMDVNEEDKLLFSAIQELSRFHPSFSGNL